MNILITGTSKGIGKSIYEYLNYSKKNNIYVVNRNNVTFDENEIICDLCNLEETKLICEKYINDLCIDVLINNAGGSIPCQLENLSLSEIKNDLCLNFISPLILIQSVIPNMKKNKFGRIVNISSISGVTGTPNILTYSAAKSAIINMTQTIAYEYNRYNITCNSISPGGINTKSSINGREKISILNKMTKDEYQSQMLEFLPNKQLIDCIDICELIDFLIHSKSINGQNINICGTLEVH